MKHEQLEELTKEIDEVITRHAGGQAAFNTFIYEEVEGEETVAVYAIGSAELEESAPFIARVLSQAHETPANNTEH